MTTATRGGSFPVPPFDEVFESEDWITIPTLQVQNALTFFDADPNVITGFNFRMDALLNGGIIFKRQGKVLKDEAKHWLSSQFSALSREILRYRWCVGFVACAWVPDEKYNGRPIVLDLSQIEIRYKRSIFGESDFRYFHQPTNGSRGMLEIKDVTTFTFDPPDRFGNLRSIIPLLAPDLMHENVVAYYDLVAMKGRALPVMVTEKDREIYDKDNISVPLARSPHEMGLSLGGGYPTKPTEANGSTDQSMQIIHHTEQYYENTAPTMSAPIMNSVESLMRVPYFQSHIKLDQGRRFINAPQPTGPADLLQFRVARQERAFSLMGVPLSMISNNASMGGGGGGGGSKKEDNNQHTFVMFDNSQQSLKLELISCIKSLFYSINMKAQLTEYLTDTHPSKWNAKDAAESAEVTVEIPSMPNEGSLVNYYNSGFITYDALTQYLASKHGIARSSFNPKPALTIKETNGIEPPAPKTSK